MKEEHEERDVFSDSTVFVQIYKINLKIAKCKNIMDLIKLSTIIYFKK